MVFLFSLAHLSVTTRDLPIEAVGTGHEAIGSGLGIGHCGNSAEAVAGGAFHAGTRWAQSHGQPMSTENSP